MGVNITKVSELSNGLKVNYSKTTSDNRPLTHDTVALEHKSTYVSKNIMKYHKVGNTGYYVNNYFYEHNQDVIQAIENKLNQSSTNTLNLIDNFANSQLNLDSQETAELLKNGPKYNNLSTKSESNKSNIVNNSSDEVKTIDEILSADGLNDSSLSKKNLDIRKKSDTNTDTNELNNIELDIAIPSWDIQDFIVDRVNWQKSLTSINGEPGYFYFKIFFNFNSDNGLLGNIIKTNKTLIKTNETLIETSEKTTDTNSATSYLNSLIEANTYKTSDPNHRNLALIKFVKYLSYISINAPWFFLKINNLQEATKVNFTKILKDNRYIEIQCMPEAIDMRLGTLLDLYRYACYDNVNFREVIPENLRKFDITVMVMNIPIKYWLTGITGASSYQYKNTNKLTDSMSFKLFNFKNCEILIDNGDNMYNELNNTKPFMLEAQSLKLSYDRVYVARFNEWERSYIGDNGYFDLTSDSTNWKKRVDYISNKSNFTNFKSMDYCEAIASYWANSISGLNTLGNLYTESDNEKYKKNLQSISQSIYTLRNIKTKAKDLADQQVKKIQNKLLSVGTLVNNALQGKDPNTTNNGLFSEYSSTDQAIMNRVANKLLPVEKNESLKLIYANMFKGNLGNLYKNE